jgi:hypothetical protein
MIAEVEQEIVAAIKASAIAGKLRAIDTLPDLSESTLKRIMTFAPAVYVIAGNFPIKDGVASLTFSLVCLARNARGDQAARQGDGITIGLYQILDYLAGLFNPCAMPSAVLSADQVRFVRADGFTAANVNAGLLTITGKVTLDHNIDESLLSDFVTFGADYDIEPFAGSVEHGKWLQEPADHTTSAPYLTDTTTLPQ